jgi:hypothetical protein
MASAAADWALFLAASLALPSDGFLDSGDMASMIDWEPEPLAPSSPRAVPPRMPPEPEVVSDTLAGAK